MNNLFGIEQLILNEKNVNEETTKIFSSYINEIPKITDLFLKLRFFFGKQSNKGLDGDFGWFCENHYIQVPYSFRVIFDLFLKGYYLDAILIERSLLEAFVKMRYFGEFPDALAPQLNQIKRITFKTMFDKFSPGSYKWYTKQLSEVAHGVFFKEIFNINRTNIQNSQKINGPKFNLFGASIVLVWMITLAFGYLKRFSLFFSNNTISNNLSFEKDFFLVITILEETIEKHKKTHPNSLNFYTPLEKLIF